MSTPRWRHDGDEPDYRFTLANERTFLAWIRTALAILAGAIAVIQFLPPTALAGTRTALAAILAAAGTVLPAAAYRRWSRIQRAMRLGQGIPYTYVMAVVAVGIAALGASMIVLAFAA